MSRYDDGYGQAGDPFGEDYTEYTPSEFSANQGGYGDEPQFTSDTDRGMDLDDVLWKLSTGLRPRWQKRWIKLTPDSVRKYTSAKRPKPGAKPKHRMRITKGVSYVEPMPEKAKHFRPFAFSLVNPDYDDQDREVHRETMTLACMNPVQYADWFGAMQRYCSEDLAPGPDDDAYGLGAGSSGRGSPPPDPAEAAAALAGDPPPAYASSSEGGSLPPPPPASSQLNAGSVPDTVHEVTPQPLAPQAQPPVGFGAAADALLGDMLAPPPPPEQAVLAPTVGPVASAPRAFAPAPAPATAPAEAPAPAPATAAATPAPARPVPTPADTRSSLPAASNTVPVSRTPAVTSSAPPAATPAATPALAAAPAGTATPSSRIAALRASRRRGLGLSPMEHARGEGRPSVDRTPARSTGRGSRPSGVRPMPALSGASGAGAGAGAGSHAASYTPQQLDHMARVAARERQAADARAAAARAQAMATPLTPGSTLAGRLQPVHVAMQVFDQHANAVDSKLPLAKVQAVMLDLGLPLRRAFYTDSRLLSQLNPDQDAFIGRPEFYHWWTTCLPALPVSYLDADQHAAMGGASATAAAAAATMASMPPPPPQSATPSAHALPPRTPHSTGRGSTVGAAPPTPRTAGVALVAVGDTTGADDGASDAISVANSTTALVVADQSLQALDGRGAPQPDNMEDVRVPLPEPPAASTGRWMGMRVSACPAVPSLGDGLGFKIGDATRGADGARHPGAGAGVSDAPGRLRDLVGGPAPKPADMAKPSRSDREKARGRRRSQGRWLPNGKRGDGDSGDAGGGARDGDVAAGSRSRGEPLSQASMSGIAREVLEHDFDEDEWNERYQRLLEWPEDRFSWAVEKGIAVAAFMGKLSRAASSAVKTIVDEASMPNSLKTIPMVVLASDDGDAAAGAVATNNEQLFFHKGLLLRVVQGSGSTSGTSTDAKASASSSLGGEGWQVVDFGDPAMVQRKVVGHEMRGLRLITECSTLLYHDWLRSVGPGGATGQRRPPPLCTVLACLVDYAGYRVNVVCIPPMDEERTLVHGRLEADAPYIQNDEMLKSMLRRAAAVLHLRPHAVEWLEAAKPGARGSGAGGEDEDDGAGAAAGGEQESKGQASGGAGAGSSSQLVTMETHSASVSLSAQVQGHKCRDGRYYLMNLARICPPDLPNLEQGSGEIDTHLLRPELVQSLPRPLSADAYSRVIGNPGDKTNNDIEVGLASQHLLEEVIPAFTQQLDSLALMPCDSLSFTRELHEAGINIRHLDSVAKSAALPHVVELAQTEMVARVCKHLLQRKLCAIIRRMLDFTLAASDTTSQAGAAVNAAATKHVAKSYALVLQKEMQIAVVQFFNLVLGFGNASVRFWRDVILPNVAAKFHGYSFAWTPKFVPRTAGGAAAAADPKTGAGRTPLHKPQLYFAMQVQCGVTFRDDVAYDFGIDAPFSLACLTPFKPVVTCMRRRELETSVLAESAEELFRQGQLDMSLQAYNLRLALLQCLTLSDSHEAADALLDSAGTFVAMGRATQALQCVDKALELIPQHHAMAARAHMLRMKAHFQCGMEEEAEAAYEAAERAARWHLGALHPVVAEMGAELARELAKEGRLDEAADHLNSSRVLAARVLGERHPIMASYCSQLGTLYRESGQWERAVQMHERALVLLDSSARAGDSRHHHGKGVTVSADNIAWLADALTLQRVADEPLRRAISRSYFCLADALAMCGRLDRAFEVASKATEVYRTLCEDHEEALLRSYQQLAAIADRLDHPAEAIMHTELVLEQVKLRHDDAAMAAVQEGTRHVIRLCLRQMTMQHRALLDRIIAQRKHIAEDPNVLRYVITQLFTTEASAYVKSVLHHVITGALPPGHNNPYQQAPPPVADQLVCLNFLAAEGAH